VEQSVKTRANKSECVHDARSSTRSCRRRKPSKPGHQQSTGRLRRLDMCMWSVTRHSNNRTRLRATLFLHAPHTHTRMLCGWLNRVELCSLGANKQTKVARENKQIRRWPLSSSRGGSGDKRGNKTGGDDGGGGDGIEKSCVVVFILFPLIHS
jgi:hypothetical protein